MNYPLILIKGAYEYELTSIQETAQNESLIQVVGNPVSATSYAEIDCEGACILLAKVYTLDGKLISSNNLGIAQSGTNRIEIGGLFQNLSCGNYLLVIQTVEKTFVAKIVK